jgi:superfamily II DNA or RNA helicase
MSMTDAHPRSHFDDTVSGFEAADAATVAHAIIDAMFPFESLCAMVPKPDDHSVPLEAFQVSAVAECERALADWGGVMLCDDVGLGKTYVALELIRRTLAQHLPAIVVIPSSLRSQWTPLLRTHAPSARVLTHAQLSRGSYSPSLLDGGGLLVIDEAHSFRSPRSHRYRAAAALSRGRSVCMVTATPVNNSVWDLYHLIRLFALDGTFASAGIPHLQGLFDEVVQAASTPPPFRRLLRLVMVRRSRSEVRSLISRGPARVRFPRLASPQAIAFDPDSGRAGSHRRILGAIADLNLSAAGENAAGLLRFLLLKRLASSPPALLSTVSRLLRFHNDFIAAIDEGLVLAPRDFSARADSTREQLLLHRMLLRPLAPGEDVTHLRAVASSDVSILEKMLHEALAASGVVRVDDKLERLRHLLLETLCDEKVLVFTEFRETAAYLWRNLVSVGGVGLVHGGDAYLGCARAGRNAVIERFARGRNSRRAYHHRERVRVLIATDVLSEGLNLQECAHVVSYDLPWNPVRLIQRIGRIDRLGSPHDVVHTYNFIPDRHLEDYLGILARLRIKLHAIGLSLGLDYPVLADEESPGAMTSEWSHLTRPAGATPGTEPSDDVLSDEALRAWIHTRLATKLLHKRTCHHGAPVSSVPISGASTAADVCFIVRHRNAVSAFICGPSGVTEVSPEAVASACIRASERATANNTLIELTPDALTRESLRLKRILARRARSSHGFRRSARSTQFFDVAAFIARRLHDSLGRLPGGPTSAQLERADRAFAMLARPLSVHASRSLRSALPDAGFDQLLNHVEAALADQQGDSEARPQARPGHAAPPEIIAVIVPPSVDRAHSSR